MQNIQAATVVLPHTCRRPAAYFPESSISVLTLCWYGLDPALVFEQSYIGELQESLAH
jgi:hypothetical protein